MIWVSVIIVVRRIIFEQKKAVRILNENNIYYYQFFYLVPSIQPEIIRLSTNQPCQIDIYLKVIKKRTFDSFYMNLFLNKGFGFNC